jgi:2-methylcitrate dehydratase PrpD
MSVEENKDLFAPGALRQAIVEIRRKEGIAVKEHVKNWPGTAENPMTNSEVEKKCRQLIAPILGIDRAQKLIEGIWKLEDIGNMRKLRHLMQAR